MKRFRIYALLLLTSCLSSCSWQEYFAIVNTTGSPIEVHYEIDSSGKGFPIFTTSFRAYKTIRNNELDWNNSVQLTDTDSLVNSVTLLLPAHTSVVIGELSNDHYSRHDQQFINDRIFNFVSIEVPDQNTVIASGEFDNYFNKKNGIVSYEIR